MKKITNIIYWLVFLFLVLIAGLTSLSTFDFAGGHRLYNVLSGSMSPAIPTGSIVLVGPVSNYSEGDIVTFKPEGDRDVTRPKNTTTHRIVEIKDEGGAERFVTKGDANETADPESVDRGLIIGKVFFHLPLLGYAVNFARTQIGLIVLIIIPATIIIYSEMVSIKNEAKRLIVKRRSRKLSSREKIVEAIGEEEIRAERGIKRFLKKFGLLKIFFLTFGVISFNAATSGAYFTSQVVLSGNSFSAGYREDDVTGVVINEVYYDVGSVCGNDGGANPDEWVELYNNNSFDVDLKDWSLTDNNDTTIIHSNSVSVPAHGYAVISKSANTWNTGCFNPPLSAIRVYTGQKIGNGLANGGDRLILKNPSGFEIDAVSWGDDSYAFGSGNGVVLTGDGKSMARKTAGVDTNSATDWEILDNPNPGTNPHSTIETNLDLYRDGADLSFRVTGGGVAKFERYEYIITYDSDAGEQGIEGKGEILGEEINVQGIYLGLCSDVCVPYGNIRNISLKVRLIGDVVRSLMINGQ